MSLIVIYRRSRQRDAILEAIEDRGGHLTADQVYALVRHQLPKLSLGTVYRNLRILVAQGRVRALDSGGQFSLFEAAKAPHYHLICRGCNRVTDVEAPVDRALTQRFRPAAVAQGFEVEDHRLELIGLCAECQA